MTAYGLGKPASVGQISSSPGPPAIKTKQVIRLCTDLPTDFVDIWSDSAQDLELHRDELGEDVWQRSIHECRGS